MRSGATAEVGRTGAGFVNAVTKSGTNEVHGEGFYFNRNRELTSPDAFGHKLNNKQNQFGGSIGGPIARDRAFFFIGVEQNFLRIPFLVQFLTPPSGIAVPANLQALQGRAGDDEQSDGPVRTRGLELVTKELAEPAIHLLASAR